MKSDVQYGYESEADMLRYIAEQQYPTINHFDYGVDMWDLPSISRDIDGAVEFGYLDEEETLWEVIEDGVTKFVNSHEYELFVAEYYECDVMGRRIYTNSALFKYLESNHQVFGDEIHIDNEILEQIREQQPKFTYKENVIVGDMWYHLDYVGAFVFTKAKRLTARKVKMVQMRLSDYYGALVSWTGDKFIISGTENFCNVFGTINNILWDLGFNDITLKRLDNGVITAKVDIISY